MADDLMDLSKRTNPDNQTSPGSQPAAGPGAVDLVRESARTVVRLSGEVDLSCSDLLSAARAEAAERGLPVRLDLSALSFIDSTGIGFVARLATLERDAGRRLAVVGTSRRITEALSLTGLDDLLDLS